MGFADFVLQIDSGIGQHLSAEELTAIMEHPYLKQTFKNPEQGAATTVWGAVRHLLSILFFF